MVALLKGEDPEGEPYETRLVSEDENVIVAHVIERKTGTAQTYRLARRLFSTPEYTGFVKIHKELEALAGTPPFGVVLGKKEGEALSFEELRTQGARDLPRRRAAAALQGPRRDERRPALRHDHGPGGAARCSSSTIDDASGADQIFSMLMGDSVEPRREFIENHAREVTNLDV